jgi:hypothetical protein
MPCCKGIRLFLSFACGRDVVFQRKAIGQHKRIYLLFPLFVQLATSAKRRVKKERKDKDEVRNVSEKNIATIGGSEDVVSLSIVLLIYVLNCTTNRWLIMPYEQRHMVCSVLSRVGSNTKLSLVITLVMCVKMSLHSFYHFSIWFYFCANWRSICSRCQDEK